MANKYSFGFSATERANQKPKPPITAGVGTGGLINANSGECNIPLTIQSRSELIELFGDANAYNLLNYNNAYDFLATEILPLTMIRPIHLTAYNAGIKYSGLTLKETGGWFGEAGNIERVKPSMQLFNKDVADFNLNNNLTTAGQKLEVLNRYVTTYKDTAVAICSHYHNYDQPILNIQVDSIRKDTISTPPTSPIPYEKYMLAGKVVDCVLTATTVTIAGDLSGTFTTGDYVYDGTTNLEITDVDYTSPNTVLTVSGADNTATSISYLGGSWATELTFHDSILVQYISSWGLVGTLTSGDIYYFQNLGVAKEWNGTSWTLSSKSFKPVYRNGSSVVSYAVEDILAPSLYGISGDVLTFKDIYGDALNFKDNEVLIVELKKNHTTEKWSVAKTHFGNYGMSHRNASNDIDYIVDIVNEQSANIYIQSGYKISKVSTTGTLPVIELGGDFRDVVIGDKLKIYDISNGTSLINTTVTVTSVVYASGDDPEYSAAVIDPTSDKYTDRGTLISNASGVTTITIQELLTGYALDVKTVISTELCANVSTNQNDFADKYSNSYDDADQRFSTGFSLADVMIYDYAITNGAGATIYDYSEVTADDMDTAAELFLDKDKIDVTILMSYMTKDEFGDYHVDKMATIAKQRKMCAAIFAPMDASLFLGKTSSEMHENVIAEYGNHRPNIFTGQFTQFSEYAINALPTMKESKDTVTGKPIALSVIGDYSRMLATLDRGAQGLYSPVANTNRGTFNNQDRLYFLPNNDQREELAMNGLNLTYYDENNMPNPVKMSNNTSYIDNIDLFKKEHVRHTLNKIEKYIDINIRPLYFQFINEGLTRNLGSIINKRLSDIAGIGTIDFYDFEFVEGDNDLLIINMNLRFAGVLERVQLNINMYPSSFTVEEIVNA